MDRLKGRISESLTKRTNRWYEEKTAGVKKHSLLTLTKLVDEAQVMCTSVQDDYILDCFRAILDVEDFIFQRMFEKLHQLCSDELPNLNISHSPQNNSNNSDDAEEGSTIQSLKLYKKLILFTKKDARKQSVCQEWFPSRLFISYIDIVKAEAEEIVTKIVEKDNGVPNYEVGFSKHGSSATDLAQMIHEKFINGLWKDLQLPRNEKSERLSLYLRNIISHLIYRYGDLLFQRFAAVLDEESDFVFVDDVDPGKSRVETAWAFINGLGFLLDRSDKIFRDLSFDKVAEQRIDDRNLGPVQPPGAFVHQPPKALAKTRLSNRVDEMVKMLIGRQVTPLIDASDNDEPSADENPVRVLMEKFRTQTSESVFEKTASLVLDEAASRLLAAGNAIPLLERQKHEEIFRKFLRVEESIADFWYEPSAAQRERRLELKTKGASTEQVICTFLDQRCTRFS